MRLFKYSHVLNNFSKQMTNWNNNQTWDEQLFDVIGRNSRAAAVVVTPCQMMVANNPNRNSKAASVSVQRQRPNKAKIIADFISNN